MNEGGEQIRGDDIDLQNGPSAQDAGVVNHSVDPAELVDLIGHSRRLVQVGQVADDT
jgi:hypothetical protein